MQGNLIDVLPLDEKAHGTITLFVYDKAKHKLVYMKKLDNTILFTGADIVARCLAGDTDYRINAMYFEYKNLAASGDPITAPSYDRSDASSYYASLAGTSDTDIVRANLMTGATYQSSGSDYNGNIVSFVAMTEVGQGYYGKAFSATTNSEVYGAALVAAPAINDITRDIIFSRVYFPQIAKQPNQQIGIRWDVAFL